MQQGSKKKQQAEQRRRRFHKAAAAGNRAQAQPQAPGHNPFGQQPQQQQPPPRQQAFPVPETRPGPGGTPTPKPQIQEHQVIHRSSIGNDRGGIGQPALAPHSGQVVPVTPHGPQESRVVQPRAQLAETPVADVTVILYSGGAGAELLAPQLEALRRQSIHPAHVWVHVDGAQGHDERTLARMQAHRSPIALGRHFRLSLARHASTRFVAILDEDTIPGRNWLERCLVALMEANPEAEDGGAAVLACAGTLVADDTLQSVRMVGPELPRDQQAAVDFGRQGWLFETSLADGLDAVPTGGMSPQSFGMRMSAGAAMMGLPTVVLDYGTDRENWASQQTTRLMDDATDVVETYRFYRELGWAPSFADPAGEAEPEPVQEQAAELEAQAPTGAFAKMDAASVPQALLGLGQQPAQPHQFSHLEQAQGQPSNLPGVQLQPTPQVPQSQNPDALADMGKRPGDKVNQQQVGPGMSVTTIERVLTDKTPKTGQNERVLQPHETSPPPVSQGTEQIVAPSPPPQNQQTERVVGSSPPPASASTERVLNKLPGQK